MDTIATSRETAAVEPPAGGATVAPPFWPGFALALAATFITIGILWDISWHETIGRDTFWTPAHMTIYLGGGLAGCVGGWLAIKYTFLSGPAEQAATVRVLGARAPLGAWIAIWGAFAMLTSAPFDNWWHNAYGLDVRIISPPHTVLALGMFGIVFGALILVLTRQNLLPDGAGSGLFIYVGGIFLVMAGVFVMEYTFPNQQHAATFFRVCAMTFPMRLITMSRAARTSFPAVRTAAVYTLAGCLAVWLLPLFPAQPKLAPIFNPVTHMVAPPFPMLLIFPALAIDLILGPNNEAKGWKLVWISLLLGTAYLAVFMPVQWFFSEFLLSPLARNWLLGSDRVWDYGARLGDWTHQFWDKDGIAQTFKIIPLLVTWLVAGFTCWIGLLLGGWMRKVRR